MARVLLTGFEPFGDARVNPSWEAVKRLGSRDVHVKLLPCVFGVALDVLWAAVEQIDPDVVICAGLAGGRPEVSVERIAINFDNARIADNAGVQPVDRPIVAGAPAGYLATIPVRACVLAVRALAIPVGMSYTAGTFVCNHVFYGLLHRAATVRPGLRGGFVHVPYLPGQGTPALPVDSVAAALHAIAKTAVSQRDDVAIAESALR
jgi:pyroglutamyl-peptidase